MWDEAGLMVGSYLLGAFPFMYLIGRLHGIDLREYDDMHLALWRNVNRLEGLAGILFDFAKGVIAVLVARAFDFEPGWVAFAGVAAVAGQMWPVFLKFQGEKGNTIGLAMSGAVATRAMGIILIPILIGASIRTIPRLMRPNQTVNERLKLGGPPSLSLPLAMAVAFAVLPLAAWLVGQPLSVIISFVVLFVLIMVRRATAGIRQDIHLPSRKLRRMGNRLLYDRSEIEVEAS